MQSMSKRRPRVADSRAWRRARAALALVAISLGLVAAQVAHAASTPRIYWANSILSTIGEAKLDGTGIKQRFIEGAHRPYGVAVHGSYIYWANMDSNTIGRANVNGTGVKEDFIKGA